MIRKNAGFTLIEAMTVLTIIAIGITIGIPGFNETIQRMRVTTTLNLLSADMAMARSAAVMRQEHVGVCPRVAHNRCGSGTDWSDGWMVFADADVNGQPDTPTDLLRVTDAPCAALLYLPASRKLLRYQPDGRAYGANLTVYLCRKGQFAAKVVVNNPGRLRSERAVSATPCPRS
ncbi:MAG: GspH/FimT family pseudopilin [Luteimonas sp.]